jgi:hypothetical protein
VDFDHSGQFSRYKTYSWSHFDSPPQDTLFPNQIMQERIAGFIEEALAARGFKYVPKGGDLLISYGMKITEQPVFITTGTGPYWGWDSWYAGGWGGGTSVTTVETFLKGTLIVNMVDANKQKLIFQGTSTQDISSRAEKNTKKLLKAVNEIFKKYP